MEKLSELSNPAWIVGQKEITDFMRGDEALLVRGYDPESTEQALRMYSQEYVHDLLEELEAKAMECRGIEQERELFRIERAAHQLHAQELEKRVAELSELETHNECLIKKNADLTQQNIKLGERLATPVRLPFYEFAHPLTERQKGYLSAIIDVKGYLRRDGFTVQGDEQ